ncbi:MAG: sigma 54-interacting transcriptional regulator, partial [Myxococcota bacterium]
VIVDCGAIPSALIESELFGHVRGAFTDAANDRLGAFESAHGGTLFLDEIGELPLSLQPKLLRAVEDRSIQRVGETKRRPVDVRLVAATHRELSSEVAAGKFRQDLFFRLAVVNVALPPLRERGRDVLMLAQHILNELGLGDAVDFDERLQTSLMQYQWPGNVRELRNAIERAAHLGADHAVPMGGGSAPDVEVSPAPDLPFKQAKEQIVSSFERAYIVRLMERHGRNISAAARDAGIDRNYLYRLLKKHDLSR